ncbi:MAG TPA: hypothetical protein VMZ28_01060 [Kofleriaceae bacterium]|nr:hypothetical protein [Kofleriaceae bacterium]
MNSPAPTTKTDRTMEDRMHAVAGDEERVEVLARARTFKRSWIELAEALAGVYEKGSWQRWGFQDFDAYCKNELCLTPATAAKLLGSFRFLRAAAPRVIERVQHEPSAPVPSLRAVDFVARATERGAADTKSLGEIRRAAFDEGVDAPALARRFKTVAFPVSEGERDDRVRSQIAQAAKRLAQLLAEPGAKVPRKAAAAVEEAIGELLEALEEETN